MYLKDKYTALLQRIGFDAAMIEFKWSELAKAYSGKSRHYHNLDHLTDMVQSFDTYISELEHPDEVLFAIFYHDYVYSATKKENELKSALFAQKVLGDNDKIDAQIVFDLIMATKAHQSTGTTDEQWMIDFDLKILGNDWENYWEYCQKIRKEYRIYPDVLYNPGRKKALQHFLEHTFIFQTNVFRTLYEDIAKDNIQMEIELLMKRQ